MSPAEQMREAARLIREDALATETEWELHVAAWLEGEARVAEQIPGWVDPHAQKAAAAYLDGAR
jgi:hypothetical protein